MSAVYIYIYRAPNTSISKFYENVSYILRNLTSKVVYICGDFIIDLLHCEEQIESKHIVDQMFSSGLYPLITRARGYKAVLDAHAQLRAQTQISRSAENACSRWL